MPNSNCRRLIRAAGEPTRVEVSSTRITVGNNSNYALAAPAGTAARGAVVVAKENTNMANTVGVAVFASGLATFEDAPVAKENMNVVDAFGAAVLASGVATFKDASVPVCFFFMICLNGSPGFIADCRKSD